MATFHLQIDIDRTTSTLRAQWFGQADDAPAGTQTWPLAPNALALAAVESFSIDLKPLLAEIAAGHMADAKAMQRADELLSLADLLAAADYAELCAQLFTYLQQETQLAKGGFAPGLETPIWIDPDRRLVRVWFATNRQPVTVAGGEQGFAPDVSVDQVHYGLCHVFIPESHKPGSIGTPWWRRWIRLEADDSLRLHSTHGLTPADFWAQLGDKMQTWWQPGQRNLFVLIHGYNVSFADAAIRAAQLGYDLKLPGEIAFYSWPSRGETRNYPADEATINASYPYIAQFLHELCEKSGAERIHLFAHSMGNRGFLRALERLAATNRPPLRLGQVFFCAPDEDVRTFTDTVAQFPYQAENRTLLVSPEDKAVALSQWLHSYRRVGIAPPVTTIPGIETIEVRGFGLLDLGHGYFAAAAPVIEDISEAIATRKRAGDRQIPQASGRHFSIEI